MKRTWSLLFLLAGCAGDPDIDARTDAVVAETGPDERASAARPPIPEAEWRAAEACGEELAANGFVVRVQGEDGLRAWVTSDHRVSCVDSAVRFASASESKATEARPVTHAHPGEPDPQPMTQAGEPDPQPMTQAGEPDPQPMIRADDR